MSESAFLVISEPSANKTGASFKVTAASQDVVQSRLGSGWVVLNEAEARARHPDLWSSTGTLSSPLDPPEPWLDRLLKYTRWRGEGKRRFLFQGNPDGRQVIREIWAEHETDVTNQFPFLKPVLAVSGADHEECEYVSIDEPDAELRAFRETRS